MLYLKGASKLDINLVFRPVEYKQNELTVSNCIWSRRWDSQKMDAIGQWSTKGQIEMAGGMAMK